MLGAAGLGGPPYGQHKTDPAIDCRMAGFPVAEARGFEAASLASGCPARSGLLAADGDLTGPVQTAEKKLA